MSLLVRQDRVFGHYTIFDKIGEGSFATVYKAYENSTKVMVAIKLFHSQRFNKPKAQEYLAREFKIGSTVQHPLIVPFYEKIQIGDEIGFVMELIDGPNLRDYANARGPLSETTIRSIFQQLISVIRYLHDELHVVHRDLKVENILVDNNQIIRLIDFGFSSFCESGNFLNTICGSPAYFAPELICGEPYTESIDIWSAGVILFALIHNELPFFDPNIQGLIQKIVNDEITIDSQCSPALADLVSRMLAKNPHDRINLSQIESHPWFKAQTPFNYSNMSYRTFSLSQPIDPEVLEKMKEMNLNTLNVVEKLNCNELNFDTTIYKILRKQKVAQSIIKLKSTKFSEIRMTSILKVPQYLLTMSKAKTLNKVESPLPAPKYKNDLNFQEKNPNPTSIVQFRKLSRQTRFNSTRAVETFS